MTGIMKHVDTNVPRMLLGALVGHCTGGDWHLKYRNLYFSDSHFKEYCLQIKLHMTSSERKVPSQKFPVPKITMQTKIDSSGDEV